MTKKMTLGLMRATAFQKMVQGIMVGLLQIKCLQLGRIKRDEDHFIGVVVNFREKEFVKHIFSSLVFDIFIRKMINHLSSVEKVY